MRSALLGCLTALVIGVAACSSSTSTSASTTHSTAAQTTQTGRAATTAASSGGASSGSKAGADPCSLLTDAEVATLESGLRPGKVDTVAGSKICDWGGADTGVPHVQLEVYASSESPHQALGGLLGGGSGYTIKDVPGLGDAAAVAIQRADASMGIKAGVASLVVQKGSQQVDISTPLVEILPDTPAYTNLLALATKAISRLG